mgnify:CR=1 FL=1
MNFVITAFYCENNDWAFFGDTHSNGDLNIFGRQLLIKFETKFHFLLKKKDDYYLISKPPLGCKGLLLGDSFCD